MTGRTGARPTSVSFPFTRRPTGRKPPKSKPRRKTPEDFISALTEPGDKPPVTYLLHRGDPKQPMEAIRPGGLTVLTPSGLPVELPEKDPKLATTGRRLAFARWLTGGSNLIVAR